MTWIIMDEGLNKAFKDLKKWNERNAMVFKQDLFWQKDSKRRFNLWMWETLL